MGSLRLAGGPEPGRSLDWSRSSRPVTPREPRTRGTASGRTVLWRLKGPRSSGEQWSSRDVHPQGRAPRNQHGRGRVPGSEGHREGCKRPGRPAPRFHCVTKDRGGCLCPRPAPPPFPPDGLIGGDPAHAFLCLSPQAFSQGEGGVEHSERGCLACKAPRTYPLTLCREGCADGWAVLRNLSPSGELEG